MEGQTPNAIKWLINGVIKRQLKKLATPENFANFEKHIFKKYDINEIFITINFENQEVKILCSFGLIHDDYILNTFKQDPEAAEAGNTIKEFISKLMIKITNQNEISHTIIFK
jgi:hypothetical protein